MKSVAKKQPDAAPAFALEREVDHITTGKRTVENLTNKGKTLQELIVKDTAAENAELKTAMKSIEEKEQKDNALAVYGDGYVVDESAVTAHVLSQCEVYVKDFFARFKGMTEAWVRMGFALIKAKEVIPHGQFIAWREEKFPQYGARHMSNSMMVADKLIEKDGVWNRKQVLNFAEAAYWDFVDQQITQLGKVSTRALLLELKEIGHGPNDSTHEQNCRKHFEDNPEDMDKYLPEVESGVKTWAQVWMALQGASQSVDENGRRKETDYTAKLWEHSRKMSHFAEKLDSWDVILPERQAMIIESTAKVIGVFPAETKEYLLKKLKAELGHE